MQVDEESKVSLAHWQAKLDFDKDDGVQNYIVYEQLKSKQHETKSTNSKQVYNILQSPAMSSFEYE